MIRSTNDYELGELIRLTGIRSVADRKVDWRTVLRWATKGLRGERLRVVSVGGARHTTERWLRDFFARVESARQRAADARRPKAPASAARAAKTAAVLKRHDLRGEEGERT